MEQSLVKHRDKFNFTLFYLKLFKNGRGNIAARPMFTNWQHTPSPRD
jgi:hypothetical protein